MHESDPFGDKLKDKERGEEEQYFAKRERALLEKLRGGNEAARETAARENTGGPCPKCAGPFSTTPLDTPAREPCSDCRGAEPDRMAASATSTHRGERWLARFLPHSLVGTR
jgi:hypothetical protein